MSSTASKNAKQVREELLDAMEHGVLTQDQLKELIRHDAGQLGLEYDEAIEAARRNQLPRTLLGIDLRFLVKMLTA